ncbi:MAG: ribosome silencing factor [Clostridiales bacterium]|jgi:ribosome-associated protein|nr:ribosome silencing factor [Clostridiales bacterium]
MDEKKQLSEKEIEQYVAEVAELLSDKKAIEIEILHVKPLTTLADYFIVCTGTSTTHIKSLSEEIEHYMETKYNIRPHHIEGYNSASWILVDYGFMTINIFHKESRKFYSLERLWK